MPAFVGQGALALKVGGKRAGRDELKCSPAEVLREVRRELDAARKPVPRHSFAKRLQQTGRDRRERTPPQDETTTTAAEEARGPPAAAVEGTQCRAKAQMEALNLKEAAA